MTIEKIWAQYRDNLKAFLRSKISNPEDVNELLQDILIKTHLNIANLKHSEKIEAWLFQIANRTIIDFYRAKKSYLEFSESDLPIQIEQDDIHQELTHCIEPFIAELSTKEAELLRSIELHGQSQKTYAESNGIHYSTLKSQVQKARVNLKHLFDNCCNFELDKQGNLVDYHQKSNCDNTCKNK